MNVYAILFSLQNQLAKFINKQPKYSQRSRYTHIWLALIDENYENLKGQ